MSERIVTIECERCRLASRSRRADPGATEAENAARLGELILAAIGDGWRAVGRAMRCPTCVARYGVTKRRRGR